MKKAVTTRGLLGMLIVVMVAGLILIIIYNKWFASAQELSIEKTCQNSVWINARSHFFGEDLVKEIKCQTQDLTVNYKQDTAIKKFIADKMVSCYNMFLKGEEELFNPADENFCVVCYVLNFEEEKTISGFTHYLAAHNVPNTDITYYSYLTGYQTTDEVIASTQATADTIDTGYDYAIIFNYAKESYWLNKPRATGIGAVGGVALISIVGGPPGWAIGSLAAIGGAIVGYHFGTDRTADWTAYTLLWPYTKEEINKIGCTYMPAKQNI